MASRLLQDPGLPVKEPTSSYWQSPLHEGMVNIQSPALPTTRDIVILGSGVTACSAASELLSSDQTLSITVLEAREICSGATGRNGGRINCVAVLDYDKYRRKFGHDAAVKIVRFELAHYGSILALARRYGAELVEYSTIREVETVAAVFNDHKMAELKRLLANFEANFPDLKGRWRIADHEETTKTFKIRGAKGALIGRAGAAWPYRLFTGIWSGLLSRYSGRFSLEANTPAVAIDKDPSIEYPYIVSTPRGEIRARHILHCTEGHATHLLPKLRGILVPRRGQMLVLRPSSGFAGEQGKRSWSFYFQNGFDYLSQDPRSHMFYLGGGDVGSTDGLSEVLGEASDAEHSLSARIHLTGVIPVVFGPQKVNNQEMDKPPEVERAWTGILCNSLDGVPLVGILPRKALDRPPGNSAAAEWICAGYGGYGMVNAHLCGRTLAGMLLGRDSGSSLPEQYHVTPERIYRLQASLAKVSHSEHHFKALL